MPGGRPARHRLARRPLEPGLGCRLMRRLALMLVLASVTVACGGEERVPTFAGTVEKEVTSDEENGIQVYVVSAEDPDGVAEECIDFYREDYSAVSCYVFESEAAFEAAGTSD